MRGGDGKIGKISTEISLSPLQKDHFSPSAPRKVVVCMGIEQHVVDRFFLDDLFRAPSCSKYLEPLYENKGKTGQLRVEAETVDRLIISLISLVLGVVVDIARGEFKKWVARRKKSSAHESGICWIAHISAK